MSRKIIGNARDARIADKFCWVERIPEVLPEGWKYLGRGISREAYLSPEGVVYKIIRRDEGGMGDCGDQNQEYQAFEVLSKIDHPIFSVPKMAKFVIGRRIVLAAEYLGCEEDNRYNFTCPCDAEYMEAMKFFRTNDLHPGNVRSMANKVYAIDLGFFNPSYVPANRCYRDGHS